MLPVINLMAVLLSKCFIEVRNPAFLFSLRQPRADHKPVLALIRSFRVAVFAAIKAIVACTVSFGMPGSKNHITFIFAGLRFSRALRQRRSHHISRQCAYPIAQRNATLSDLQEDTILPFTSVFRRKKKKGYSIVGYSNAMIMYEKICEVIARAFLRASLTGKCFSAFYLGRFFSGTIFWGAT